MNVINVNDLTKVYSYTKKDSGLKGSINALFNRKRLEKVAINGISFKVEKGEFIGLIGPNGAGKTTLMKMLTGIIAPTAGKVEVLGYTPGELKDEFKKKYSLVMGQKSQLWWDLPAIDSFLLNKVIYGVSEKEFKEKMDYFIKIFDIEHLLNVQVRQLSLGERMKMELISCLLHNPEILFLDEPTIGLDVIAQKNIRQFLKDINSKLETTIILTSHYMEDIKHLCKRVMVVNHGQKIYDGKLENILSKYKESKIVTINFEKYTEVDLRYEVEWIEKGPYKIVIKVQNDMMNKILQTLLENYEIDDILIEEEEISYLIEKIYNAGDNI